MQISRMLRNLSIFASLLIVSSCLSLPAIIDMPDKSFNRSENESLVFGRIEIIGNDMKIQPIVKHYFIKDSANRGAPVYLVVYRLIEKPSNVIEMGKSYHILVFREDGYFSAALPKGKYGIYSVRINLKYEGFNLLTTASQHRVRSQDGEDIPGDYKRYRDGTKINFDVLPGQDVYIGTVRVIASSQMLEEERVSLKAGYNVTPSGGYLVPTLMPRLERYNEIVNKLVAEELQIADEFQFAKEVFSSIYPDLSGPVKRLGYVSDERWYSKRWKMYVDQE